MGAEDAVEIVFRKEIDGAQDKAAKRAELIEQYREAFSNPYVAAGRRLVDSILEPSTTRQHLARVFEYLHTKREFCVRPRNTG
jgi:methylmalonyl-CoA carboxyltransferase 12S subunit